MAGTKPGHDDCKYYWLRRSDSEFLLLCRGLGLGGLRSLRLGLTLRCRLLGLVHALDLRGFAQLRHIIRLRLARHIGLDLGLDLLELGRLAAALFLDLDDVP